METERTHPRIQLWGDSLVYYRYEPRESAPARGWPLVLFLHGFTGAATVPSHGSPVLLRRHARLRQCVHVAPYCSGTRFWQIEPLFQLIEWTQASLRIDPRRIYVVGYSAGAYAAWALVSLYPGIIAAAIPISGGGSPTRLSEEWDTCCGCVPFPRHLPLCCVGYLSSISTTEEFDPTMLARARNTQVWTFHGTRDFVIPAEETLNTVAILRSRGHENVRVTTPPLNHDETWKHVLVHDDVFEWLLGVRLPAFV